MHSLFNHLRFNPTVRRLIFPLISVARFSGRKKIKLQLEVYEQLRRLLIVNPVVHIEEFDSDFLIDKNSQLFSRLLLFGNYEPKLVNYCSQHLDKDKDVIDVGANIGFYSVFFAKKINKECRVLSIEPTKTCLEKLRENLDLNSVKEKVVVFDGVVSNIVGELIINTIPGNEEFSTIGTLNHPSMPKGNHESYKVESSTIDLLVEKFSLNPGFIKCDVEGAEHLVLEGCDHVMKVFRPTILMEVSDHLLRQNGSSAQALIGKIFSYGYDIIDADYPNLKPGSRPYGEILCTPKST
jgi:FkbM family methyltransferase